MALRCHAVLMIMNANEKNTKMTQDLIGDIVNKNKDQKKPNQENKSLVNRRTDPIGERSGKIIPVKINIRVSEK